MTEVNYEVRDMHYRAAKHIPRAHPAWYRLRIRTDDTLHQVVIPIKEQLYEDTKWKK